MNSSANEIAELKSMLTQVLSHLRTLSIQGISNPPPPSSQPNAMDASINPDTGGQLKCTGYPSPPTLDTTTKHKCSDNKTTPLWPDF